MTTLGAVIIVVSFAAFGWMVGSLLIPKDRVKPIKPPVKVYGGNRRHEWKDMPHD